MLCLLTKIPGVGKKTAERLILELKDKFSDTEFQSSNTSSSKELDDIQNALSALDIIKRIYCWLQKNLNQIFQMMALKEL